jgi:hypothetical protein
MSRCLPRFMAIAAVLLISFGNLGPALAQKSGGVLKIPDFASPASMSIHEEVTRAAINALMPVFNNLVLFDQHKAQNTIDTIVPEVTFHLKRPQPYLQPMCGDPLRRRRLRRPGTSGRPAFHPAQIVHLSGAKVRMGASSAVVVG